MKEGEASNKEPTNVIANGSTNMKESGTQNPAMIIVPVKVKLEGDRRQISTYAFIDNGCGAVFCDHELAKNLQAKTNKTKLVIKTLNYEESVDSVVVVDDLQIAGLEETEYIDLPTVYIQNRIPVSNIYQTFAAYRQGLNTKGNAYAWNDVPAATMPQEVQEMLVSLMPFAQNWDG